MNDLVAAERSRTTNVTELAGRAVATAPISVEPDAIRALSSAPQLAFPSFVSARPSIRGADLDDASLTVDGIEAINLFHVGRYISAFPPLAVGKVRLNAQPAAMEVGNTLSGRIEIEGLVPEEEPFILAQYGLGMTSLAGALPGRIGLSGAVRSAAGSAVGVAADLADFHFSVRDAYLHGVSRIGATPLRGTVFASKDELVSNDETAFMHWSNLILGVEADLKPLPSLTIRPRAFLSRHSERAIEIDARNGEADVDNQFELAGIAVAGTYSPRESSSNVVFGGSLAKRAVINRILVGGSPPIPGRDYRGSMPEFDAHLAGSRRVRGLGVELGLRVDGSNGVTRWQPGLSITSVVSNSSRFEFGVRRAARLHQIVSDAKTDPKLAYYDYWLNGGVDGAPVAQATVASMGYQAWSSKVRWGVSIFGSKGTGSVDLAPEEQVGRETTFLRFGRSRTVGVEISAGAGDLASGNGFNAAYSLMRTDRDWGGGWVPANLDKRHRFKVLASKRIGSSTILSTGTYIESAAPFTPITSFSVGPGPSFIAYGRENSSRGKWGARIDASLLYAVRGPGSSHLELGASITNLSIGDQSPREGQISYSRTPYITSNPLITLPPIPSILIRGWLGLGPKLGGRPPY
ncbi:MAG: hypothetical protein V4558_04715 [Gemmatimonadota bacterium]